MAEKPISLAKFRKSRDRQQAKAQADANAVKFGRNKAEKSGDTARATKAKRDLDGHQRDDSQ